MHWTANEGDEGYEGDEWEEGEGDEGDERDEGDEGEGDASKIPEMQAEAFQSSRPTKVRAAVAQTLIPAGLSSRVKLANQYFPFSNGCNLHSPRLAVCSVLNK